MLSLPPLCCFGFSKLQCLWEPKQTPQEPSLLAKSAPTCALYLAFIEEGVKREDESKKRNRRSNLCKFEMGEGGRLFLVVGHFFFPLFSLFWPIFVKSMTFSPFDPSLIFFHLVLTPFNHNSINLIDLCSRYVKFNDFIAHYSFETQIERGKVR